MMSDSLPPVKRGSYSPAETAMIKYQTVNEIVSAQCQLLEKAPSKTDLNDLSAVQRVANECMQMCADVGCLPNFELLASTLGYSRRGLYDFLQRHGDTETAQFIDRLRTMWASMRQMAVDRSAASETLSIFILLNSSLGFTNQHQIEIAPPRNSLEELDPVAARKRIEALVASLPEED